MDSGNNNRQGGNTTGSSDNDWCTIESDPGVFTEMLETLGCTSVEFEELYSLDDDSLMELQLSTKAIYGLIFLFQWQDNQSSKSQPVPVSTDGIDSGGTTITTTNDTNISNRQLHREPLQESQIPEKLFFAQQVTTNACATQAILSVLFNAATNTNKEEDKSSLFLGKTLSEFQSFVTSFPPHLKGVAISSSDEIKKAHNAFNRADSLYLTQEVRIPTSAADAGEVFHFIAYVPHGNVVYELDGLQKGPIVIGKIENSKVNGEGEGDSGAQVNSEGSSSLTASTKLIPSWLTVARAAIQERMIAAGEENVKFNLMAVVHDKRVTIMESENDDTSSSRLAIEQSKREQWRIENQRRRHNYVPFCIQYLKELARIRVPVTTGLENNNHEEHSSTIPTQTKLTQVIDVAKENQRLRQQNKKNNNLKMFQS